MAARGDPERIQNAFSSSGASGRFDLPIRKVHSFPAPNATVAGGWPAGAVIVLPRFCVVLLFSAVLFPAFFRFVHFHFSEETKCQADTQQNHTEYEGLGKKL